MQSQQKKVKWSRGETADALEERTDTGITQVSVSKMQNIIADTYGNISRRPAFKIIPFAEEVLARSITASTRAKMVPFKIAKDDCVFFVFPNQSSPATKFAFYRVKKGKIVYSISRQAPGLPIGSIPTGYAQYNNFMIIAFPGGNVKVQATNIEEEAITFSFETFEYSGTWYSDGTIQYQVSSDNLTGFAINTNQTGYSQITVSTNDGIETNMYSAVSTGLTNTPENTIKLAEAIPPGSIVAFPNMGGQMRVEGICAYVSTGSIGLLFPGYIFDDVYNSTPPSTGVYCVADPGSFHLLNEDFRVYVNGKVVAKKRAMYIGVVVQSRASSTGFFQYGGSHNGWSEYPAGNLDLYLYGEQLSPATNTSGVDPTVTVLAGYEELDSNNSIFRTVTFSNQRLYAGGWTSRDVLTEHGALVVASQVAKYNDFKNNYNAANEAITIDVSTKAKEQVFHVVDYNGIQILTDLAEYSYKDGAVIKQSENGTLKDCMPVVFSNTMLYADRSERYICMSQYQLQSNVFGSTKINAMAQEDLIFHPVSISFYEEKDHFAGTFLFVINDPTDKLHDKAELAVCNLLPGNQEVIWTRWDSVSFPYTYTTTNETTTTLRYAWRNQMTGVTTYTSAQDPVAGSDLYKANGDSEDQFYRNKVYSVNEDTITILSENNSTTGTMYAWDGVGTTYYTTSSTPSVNDILYVKQAGDIFVPVESDAYSGPETKVWGVSGSQIETFPYLYYWKSSADVHAFYKEYWSTIADPQVGDTIYGWHITPPPFFDVNGYDPLVVIARSGSTLTIKRLNIETYEEMTIVATRTPSGDENAWEADRNSTKDQDGTINNYVYDTLTRFSAGNITHTESETITHSGETSIIKDTVQVDNKVYFLCGVNTDFALAELDFNQVLDFAEPVIENKYTPGDIVLEGATVQVYDGDTYKFDAVVGSGGVLSVDTSTLTNPRAGFWINAELVSHPIDVGGKTYTDHKRIGKCVAVVRDTEPGSFSVCNKTGYTDNDKKTFNFYGCSGMKNELRYTIKNIQGAKFTIESLTMIIEYATLDS